MKRFARAAAVAGITIGLSVFAAPAAFADIELTAISESGPGDLAVNETVNSPFSLQAQQNKPVTVGEVDTDVYKSHLKDSPFTFEVEGPEQDQND